MSHTVFFNGTVVQPTWLQDLDTVAYTYFGNGTSLTGNLVVPGLVRATGGAAPASTTTSVSLWATGGNNGLVSFVDTTRTANNKIADLTWNTGSFQIRFVDDAYSTTISPFVIQGGKAAGITGIQSNSGSGSWAHTGSLSTSVSVVTPLVDSGASLTLALNAPTSGNGRMRINGAEILAWNNAAFGPQATTATIDCGFPANTWKNVFTTIVDSGTTGALTFKTNNGTTQAIISNAGVHSLKTQRTTSTNVIALSIDDNATGAQTVGKGAYIQWTSNSGNTAAQIGFEAGGDGTNNQSQISFYTQASAGALTKQLSISSAGAITVPNVSTTASAANAFLDNAASNNLLRSTSSVRYKKNIHDLKLEEAQNIVLNAKPIVYDPKEGGRTHIGFSAEQIADLDERVITVDKEGQPDWVQYPHLTAPLMLVVQDLCKRIQELEQRYVHQN